MFAALTFDRDPLRWQDLPAGVIHWIQAAGGFAAVGLLLFLIAGLPRWRAQDRAAVPGWLAVLFLGATAVSLLAYLATFAVLLGAMASETLSTTALRVQNLLLTIAGGAAIVAVGVPFLLNLFRLRFRRIYALAKLSFKEAIRRRVLYAFSGMLLVFLFASWFVPSLPKDQVRTYVSVVFLAMTLLLLFTAVLLSAFSIPTDIKQQTIHTIVTKPVERFEVVLGRFLGFLALMTLVLVVMTGISLLYVLRGIHPEAAAESLKARMPYYGELRFEGTENERQAINVGREWDYRSYITRVAPGQPEPTARWDFFDLPPSLADRNEVRCEYSFDVYRTTKGDEGRAVFCTMRFTTWRYRKGNEKLFRDERDTLRKAGKSESDINNTLAEKYGYFEINSQPVMDYVTQTLILPGGLFRNALSADPERESDLRSQGETKVPLRLRVVCDSPTQYVGMAKRDFYLRLDEATGSERGQFAVNFFKGAFGLWMQLALIIGLAVVLSTYLNGVISLLVTLVLFAGGFGRDFVVDVALGRNYGGGPLEAMKRMAERQLTGPSLSDSGSLGDQIISHSDEAFRWVIRRVIDVIPDVERFDLTDRVAEGFHIPWAQDSASAGSPLLLLFLLLAAYLLPWGVLAYYLIGWREIANPQ